MVFGSHSAQAALTRLGRVDDSNLCVLVRIQYAIALGQGVSLGVVSYSTGWIDLADTEPGLRAVLDPLSAESDDL